MREKYRVHLKVFSKFYALVRKRYRTTDKKIKLHRQRIDGQRANGRLKLQSIFYQIPLQ